MDFFSLKRTGKRQTKYKLELELEELFFFPLLFFFFTCNYINMAVASVNRAADIFQFVFFFYTSTFSVSATDRLIV